MKKLLSIFFIIALLTANISVFADVSKDETVYVKLKYDGSVEDVRVVNHIYGSGNTEYFTDYGSYSKIKNMTGSMKPEVKGDEIKWPMEILRANDIYYEGATEQKLPIELGIKYYLDGKIVDAQALGGKSGHFKMDISIKYSKSIDWSSAGLLAQLQLTPDLDVFSNIQTDSSRVVVGKKANITFVSFPPSEHSFSFEADGKNIYLEPLNITLVPSSFNLPENAKKGVDKLGNGLDSMQGGSGELVKAAEALAAGTDKLKYGLGQFSTGIGQLHQGTKELSNKSATIADGLEQFHGGIKEMSKQGGTMIQGFGKLTEGMEALSAKGEQIYQGLDQVHGGLQSVNTGVNELSGGLDRLTQGHSQLAQLASMYANSSDPMLRKLAEGVIQEGSALNKLNTGLKESSRGIAAIEGSAGQLHKGFGEYKGGTAQILSGMRELQKGIAALPGAIERLSTSFGEIKAGMGKYFEGVIEMNKALGSLKNKVKVLPDNVAKLADGQTQLKDGIVSMDKGINEMTQGISGSMLGSLINNRENNYKSFANNGKNKNSTVQFVMKTPSIDRPIVKTEEAEVKQQKKNFLQRFLDLFR